jgi:excisionase family DNA binding protein
MNTTSKHLLTEEVAEQLRLSPVRVRALCREGKLPYIRLGERKMGILQSDVDAFVRKNNTPKPVAAAPSQEVKS